MALTHKYFMQFQVQKHWEHTQGKCIDSKVHIYITVWSPLKVITRR